MSTTHGSIRFWSFRRLGGLLGMLCWLGVGALYAQQQPVTFEAKADQTQVRAGNRVEITFTLRNASGKSFKMPQVQGMQRVNGEEFSSGGGFVNGRPYYQESWVLLLEATSPGNYVVGPATVIADGKKLSTKPITIKVKPSIVTANQKVFIRNELLPSVGYPGQQITARVKLFTLLSIESADMIDLPESSNLRVAEKRRFDTRVQTEKINGKLYAVRTLYEAALFAAGADTFTVDAARARVGVVRPGSGKNGLTMLDNLQLEAAPVELNIQALPQPVPEGFSGMVGKYNWQIGHDKDSLSTNDAITLTVDVTGNGDAKMFSPPPMKFPDGFEVLEPKIRETEDYETLEGFVHHQVIDYVALPKQAGEFDLVPSFVYLDPDSNKYITIAGAPIHLKVVQGANSLSTPYVGNEKDAADRRGLKLFFATMLGSRWFWIIFILIVIAVFAIRHFRHKKTHPAPVVAAAPAPRPEAQPDTPDVASAMVRFMALRPLLQNGEPRPFYDALLKSLQSYLGDRLHISPALMSKYTLRQLMEGQQVPEHLIQLASEIWQNCEQVLYAGQGASADMPGDWHKTETLVWEMETKRVGN